MTEAFDPGWLELREPVDHRSRAAELLPHLRQWWMGDTRASVLDLGCGTGSNLRYLAAELPAARTWTLLDHDAELLARIRPPGHPAAGARPTGPTAASDARPTGSTAAPGDRPTDATAAPGGHPTELDIRPVQGDLADEGLAEVANARLVTASALLDLVSELWLRALVDACVEAGCGALFALSYDGAVAWDGAPDAFDEHVLDAVNDNQRTDKGLGSALGPAAASKAEKLFRERGYRTWLAASPWKLGPDDGELVLALIEGWVDAAVGQRPGAEEELRAWAERRRSSVSAGEASLTVGHLDMLALPPTP